MKTLYPVTLTKSVSMGVQKGLGYELQLTYNFLSLKFSAGIHIKATKCSFESYLRDLPHSQTTASSVAASGSDYPETPISATAEATRKLAESVPCLKKVIHSYVHYKYTLIMMHSCTT